MAQARITVVDDNIDFLELVSEILGDAGHVVTPLLRAGIGVEDLAASHPDVVVLDLRPTPHASQLSGWEFLRLLRAHERLSTVPILVCSGDLDDVRRHATEIERDPMVSTLAKPFGIDDIERSLAELIAARPAPAWNEEEEIVLVADQEANLIDASAAALRTLGMGLDDLRRRSVADIVVHGSEWTRREWQAYRTNGRWEGSVTLRTAAGAELPAVATAEIVLAGGSEWHLSRLRLLDLPAPRAPTSQG
jgi:CheY-like chemotaxis protein